jgi:hypothetical protein
VGLFHPYHLYHHVLFELLHHDHHSVSTLDEGRNNAHEDDQLDHNYHM